MIRHLHVMIASHYERKDRRVIPVCDDYNPNRRVHGKRTLFILTRKRVAAVTLGHFARAGIPAPASEVPSVLTWAVVDEPHLGTPARPAASHSRIRKAGRRARRLLR